MSTRFKDFLNEVFPAGYKETKPMATRRAARMDAEDQGLRREATTLLDEAKRLLGTGKVKHMFTLGTELFSAASPFLEKPTWWNAGKSLFSMGKALVEDVDVFNEDYFAGDEWTQPYSADFNQTLVNVLQRFPYERIKTSDENVFIRICTLPSGVRCGWLYSSKTHAVEYIYVETERLQEAKDAIKALLWEQFKGKSLVMRKNTRIVIKNGAMEDVKVIFEVDDAFASKRSQRADELSEQLQRPLAAGVPRSIMFYGPPGTGKSTMARTLVERLGLRSFRIRIADLSNLDNATLFEAINIFQPEAVIMDDFDRATGQSSLLETLEFFQTTIKLIVTTVNNRSKLDGALLRPGRIDILELVDRMDDEVIKHVLGEYSDGFNVVKNWPISFIEEYVKRRTYMSREETEQSVKELAARVAELQDYSNDTTSDVNKMIKLLVKRKAKAHGSQTPPVNDGNDDPFDRGE